MSPTASCGFVEEEPWSKMSTSETTAKHETTIAVIGGGIGGILTAIGLGKQGYNVHLFEQAPKFSEIGAGIAM